jgi:hypothetical protein
MSLSASVIVAHTPSASALASALTQDLRALGVEAEPLSFGNGSRPARVINAASEFVVVLWTEDARKAARLRTFAARARKRAALLLMRVDASTPPIGLGPSQRMPRGRSAASAWRQILESKRMPEDILSPRTTRGAALLALSLMALVPLTASYFVDAAFAARVDLLAEQARAFATGLFGG